MSDIGEDPLARLRELYVVRERDIDLLLLEELHSSPYFVHWFGQRMGLQSPAFIGAWYSVSNADGESDLLLRVLVGNERVGVLIEDKIAASEQPDQDERYHTRGDQGVKDKWFDRYVTCVYAHPGRIWKRYPLTAGISTASSTRRFLTGSSNSVISEQNGAAGSGAYPDTMIDNIWVS